MRLQVVLLICSILSIGHALWGEQDHEIFRLKDEVAAAEGSDVTFYDFVGVQPGATNKEIQEAFRRKSKAIHPDKVRHQFVVSKSVPKPKKPGDTKKPGVHASRGPTQREIDRVVKKATERYQRLGVVAKLLRSEHRERYDHFLRYGFPTWRGTGYYYSRYRPGFGTVLLGLFLVGGGLAHYGAMRISYNSQRSFMEKYIKSARKTAWGDESGIRGIPGVSGPVDTPQQEPNEEEYEVMPRNRRERREYERQSKKDKSKPSTAVKGSGGRVLGTGENIKPVEPQGERRRVTAENGKVLIVDSVGNVFLEEEDEDGNIEEFLLDLDDIHVPTFRDTAVVKFPLWVWRKATDRLLTSASPVPPVKVTVVEEEEEPKQEVPKKETPPPPPAMTSSQMLVAEYEMVDSGVEKDAASGNNGARKRGKKSKK